MRAGGVVAWARCLRGRGGCVGWWCLRGWRCLRGVVVLAWGGGAWFGLGGCLGVALLGLGWVVAWGWRCLAWARCSLALADLAREGWGGCVGVGWGRGARVGGVACVGAVLAWVGARCLRGGGVRGVRVPSLVPVPGPQGRGQAGNAGYLDVPGPGPQGRVQAGNAGYLDVPGAAPSRSRSSRQRRLPRPLVQRVSPRLTR